MTILHFIDPQIAEIFKMKLTALKTQHFVWKTFHCTKIHQNNILNFYSHLIHFSTRARMLDPRSSLSGQLLGSAARVKCLLGSSFIKHEVYFTPNIFDKYSIFVSNGSKWYFWILKLLSTLPAVRKSITRLNTHSLDLLKVGETGRSERSSAPCHCPRWSSAPGSDASIICRLIETWIFSKIPCVFLKFALQQSNYILQKAFSLMRGHWFALQANKSILHDEGSLICQWHENWCKSTKRGPLSLRTFGSMMRRMKEQ